MEARIVRGELQKCYRGEGVNQLQNCKELAERYAGMIRENKVSLGFNGCSIWIWLTWVDQGIHGHRYRVDGVTLNIHSMRRTGGGGLCTI